MERRSAKTGIANEREDAAQVPGIAERVWRRAKLLGRGGRISRNARERRLRRRGVPGNDRVRPPGAIRQRGRRQPLTMVSRACLFLITRVEPMTWSNCFLRKSASKRVTVSRDEPII